MLHMSKQTNISTILDSLDSYKQKKSQKRKIENDLDDDMEIEPQMKYKGMSVTFWPNEWSQMCMQEVYFSAFPHHCFKLKFFLLLLFKLSWWQWHSQTSGRKRGVRSWLQSKGKVGSNSPIIVPILMIYRQYV